MSRCLIAYLLVVSSFSAIGANGELPTISSPVTDHAGMIDASSKSTIDKALRYLRKEGGTQIAVVTLDNLDGRSIEQVAIDLVEKNPLGDKETDDGVLLLVAQKERRLRIEVGQGLEGRVTDAYASRIIREKISPLFKSGYVGPGLIVGVFEIAKLTNPEIDLSGILGGSQPTVERSKRRPLPSLFWLLFFGPILLFNAFGRRWRGRRYRSYGAWGGGLGGGMSGGGFGGGFGGGGGGFSGGGASGGW